MPDTTSPSRAHVLIFLVSLALATAGCQTEPLVAPPPIAAAMSPEQTRAAILRALINSHYLVVSEQPGEIVARYGRSEDWNFVVAIDYSTQVVVRYVSSENLEYGTKNGVPVIHGGYNKRVARLSKVIGTELALARITDGLPAVAAPPPAGAQTK